MTKKLKSKLTGVPETMLIPLRARYNESRKENGIIYDPKSIEILDRIAYDFSGKKEVSRTSQFGVAIRTEILDEAVNGFLIKHPEGIVVNLGCGLDTRFHRIDNGKVTWYDLDLPEAIRLRKNFYTETKRFKFIPKSVTDYTWLAKIPKGKKVLFIAEGLLMYFPEIQVKGILEAIGKAFPGSEMVFEAMSSFIARNSDKHADVKKYEATFKWGIGSGKELEDWGIGITFVEEQYYFGRHKDKMPFALKLMALIPAFGKTMKIVRIRFDR